METYLLMLRIALLSVAVGFGFHLGRRLLQVVEAVTDLLIAVLKWLFSWAAYRLALRRMERHANR